MIRFFFKLHLLACMTLALLLPAAARAQIAFPKRPIDTTTLEKMRTGTIDIGVKPSAQHEQLLQDNAVWLAHCLVHPPFNGQEPERKTGEDIESLMGEADKWLSWPNPRQPPNEAQLNYAKAFGKFLEYEVMDVYKKADKKLDRMNAARMLSLIGKMPFEPIAEIYLKMIREDAYPPEIKLFAFQGLRNLLATPDPNSMTPDPSKPTKHFIRNNAKLAEISDELEKYITRKYPPTLPAEEARVVQYIRREAVRAMAQMRNSVIFVAGMPVARPIMTLLRVATNDKYVKAGEAALPSLGYHILDQIEAVIGICSMLPDRNLNQDVVAYLVNDALVDIAAYQAKERTDYQKDNRNKPLVPWRITGIRLMDALKQWKTNAATGRNPTFVTGLVDQAMQLKCLPKLEATDAVTAQPDYRAFDDWKRDPTRKPKSTQVFVEDPATNVEIK